eukprot:210265-Pelagomonas_calceolata.AAC.2
MPPPDLLKVIPTAGPPPDLKDALDSLLQPVKAVAQRGVGGSCYEGKLWRSPFRTRTLPIGGPHQCTSSVPPHESDIAASLADPRAA